MDNNRLKYKWLHGKRLAVLIAGVAVVLALGAYLVFISQEKVYSQELLQLEKLDQTQKSLLAQIAGNDFPEEGAIFSAVPMEEDALDFHVTREYREATGESIFYLSYHWNQEHNVQNDTFFFAFDSEEWVTAESAQLFDESLTTMVYDRPGYGTFSGAGWGLKEAPAEGGTAVITLSQEGSSGGKVLVGYQENRILFSLGDFHLSLPSRYQLELIPLEGDLSK